MTLCEKYFRKTVTNFFKRFQHIMDKYFNLKLGSLPRIDRISGAQKSKWNVVYICEPKLTGEIDTTKFCTRKVYSIQSIQ